MEETLRRNQFDSDNFSWNVEFHYVTSGSNEINGSIEAIYFKISYERLKNGGIYFRTSISENMRSLKMLLPPYTEGMGVRIMASSDGFFHTNMAAVIGAKSGSQRSVTQYYIGYGLGPTPLRFLKTK